MTRIGCRALVGRGWRMFASLRLPAIALPLSIVSIDDPISLAGAKAGVTFRARHEAVPSSLRSASLFARDSRT